MGGVALAHLRHWAKTIVIVTDFTNFAYVDVTDFANFASFTHTVLQYCQSETRNANHALSQTNTASYTHAHVVMSWTCVRATSWTCT